MKKENIKIDVKKVSIESLIRKEKYIDQFKDLVLESKKIGKFSFTKIKKFFNPDVLNTSKFEIILSFLNNQGISISFLQYKVLQKLSKNRQQTNCFSK